MVIRYPPTVESVLSASGWTPERRVSIDHWVAPLCAEGYTLCKPAEELLANLGGLAVHLAANPPKNPYEHNLIFDPLYYGSGERDRVVEWENQLKTRLFPIAYVTQACPVWAAESGAIYYGHEFGLYSLGTSFDEALSRLLTADIEQSPIIP